MLWDDKCGVGSSSVCLDRLFEKYRIAAGVKSGLKEVHATINRLAHYLLKFTRIANFLCNLSSKRFLCNVIRIYGTKHTKHLYKQMKGYD